MISYSRSERSKHIGQNRFQRSAAGTYRNFFCIRNDLVPIDDYIIAFLLYFLEKNPYGNIFQINIDILGI